MAKKLNLTGEKFGRLEVTGTSFTKPRKTSGTTRFWECYCECGTIVSIRTSDLRSGKTKSCGCLHKDIVTKHGDWKESLYGVWAGIKQRCHNPNSRDYQKYGKLGVFMENEWLEDYEAFREYVGSPPDDHLKYSLDRIDNTKGYIKGNIRWATQKQQCRNKGAYSSNKTGVTGVYRKLVGNNYYFVSYWVTDEGVNKTKCFSVKKYGEYNALVLAAEYRYKMIQEINKKTEYPYSDGYGDSSYVIGGCYNDGK